MTNRNSAYKPIPEQISKIVETHLNNPGSLLEVLFDLQKTPEGMTRDGIINTARVLKIPAHRAFGIASFYSMLTFSAKKNTVRICDGPVCWLKHTGHNPFSFSDFLSNSAASVPEGWQVERSSCLGMCDQAPAAMINSSEVGPFNTVEELYDPAFHWSKNLPDYSNPRKGELRVMLQNSYRIDPEDIHSSLKFGAYQGLLSALKSSPDEVISLVEASGLQGRGGAGFPVGRKWRFVAQASKDPKYIVANADESEPLIFKDRILMDTNPHQLLEGIAIAGYACGAREAYIYIRGEYAKQADKLERAIQQAYATGWLGDSIQNSGFSFRIHVHKGAGAYICGEETALLESLEGKRGEPRLRPPYPPSYGYLGCPTAVNNIESLSVVPSILRNGVEWWKSLSPYPVAGTKIYMVLGHVNHPGIFEAPFGLTLRQVVDDFGGGLLPGSQFNFALTGGAAGTIVNKDFLDIPLDYNSSQKGIGLGAGSFLICDQSVSLLGLLRELLHFFTIESCGKCTPCRVGTWRSYNLLAQMADGQVVPTDINELKALSENMFLASFCGLGQSVAIPINSAISNFPGEFISPGKRE